MDNLSEPDMPFVQFLMSERIAFFPRCEAVVRALGGLTVSEWLPAAISTDPPPQMAVRYEGSARDAAYGQCLRPLAEGNLAAAVARCGSAHHENRDFLIPPEAPCPRGSR